MILIILVISDYPHPYLFANSFLMIISPHPPSITAGTQSSSPSSSISSGLDPVKLLKRYID